MFIWDYSRVEGNILLYVLVDGRKVFWIVVGLFYFVFFKMGWGRKKYIKYKIILVNIID